MKLSKLLKTLSLVVLLASPAYAQKAISLNTSNVNITQLVWIGCEGTNCAGKTVDATAGGVTLTSSSYNPTVTDLPSGFSRAQVAVCTNSGAKIWVTPTSTITLASAKGQPIPDGQSFTIYYYDNISGFHAIRDAAVSSTLYCDYYRQP